MLLTNGTLVANWAALKGPLVRDGQYWRLITYSLLHGSFVHLAMNGLALLALGKDLELTQGRWRLGWVYLFSVLTASFASVWWHPFITSVGASGGVFGLIGMELAQVIRFRKDFPKEIWKCVGRSLVAALVINGLLLVVPFIDGAAHVGGFAGGLVLGLLLNRSPIRPGRPATWEWVAAGITMAAAVAFGAYAIATIPSPGR